VEADRRGVHDRQGPDVITPLWTNGLAALVEHAPAVLAVVICTYVVLIGIAAVVGSLHPDEKIRADAHEVLERLLGHGRRTKR
jgi:hypothetical protein